MGCNGRYLISYAFHFSLGIYSIFLRDPAAPFLFGASFQAYFSWPLDKGPPSERPGALSQLMSRYVSQSPVLGLARYYGQSRRAA